jgi:hypothetical protein
MLRDKSADLTTTEIIRRQVQPKTVTAAEIIEAVRFAVSCPPIHSRRPKHYTTRLAIKLHQGGCGPTSIDLAEDRRIEWLSYLRNQTPDIPGAIEAGVLAARRLHALAEEAEIEARPDIDADGKYGREMWKTINDRCHRLELPEFPHAPPDTLIGGVSDLVSRCKVWLSDRFDVEAAQEAAMTKQDQSKATAS